jgi:hypothetical protein
MTITVQLKPALEATLLDQAAREGVDANTLVLRTLEQRYGAVSAHSAETREEALLSQISEGPSEPVWQRYHELSAKRDAKVLSAAEHEELVGLSEKIETAGVQRIVQTNFSARIAI